MLIVQCKQCKYFSEDKVYKGEGYCSIDSNYARKHHVCRYLKEGLFRLKIKKK